MIHGPEVLPIEIQHHATHYHIMYSTLTCLELMQGINTVPPFFADGCEIHHPFCLFQSESFRVIR